MDTPSLSGVFTALKRLYNMPNKEIIDAGWPRHKKEMKEHLLRKLDAASNIAVFYHMLDLEHQRAFDQLMEKLSK